MSNSLHGPAVTSGIWEPDEEDLAQERLRDVVGYLARHQVEAGHRVILRQGGTGPADPAGAG
jgi:hypothetical protein